MINLQILILTLDSIRLRSSTILLTRTVTDQQSLMRKPTRADMTTMRKVDTTAMLRVVMTTTHNQDTVDTENSIESRHRIIKYAKTNG